jgi:hypothetical protein
MMRKSRQGITRGKARSKSLTTASIEESTLTVIFSGSCGFVPDIDWKKVRVLLPARRQGWVPDIEKGTVEPVVVPPHRAFMKFRVSYLHPDSPRKPDFEYLDDGDRLGICFLQNEILSLPNSLDQSFFPNLGALKNKAKPQPADSRSLNWIADIDGFCKKAKLDKKHLDPAIQPDVAAMLDVSAGFLETHFVPAEEFQFEPDPDNGTYQQCLAGQVRLSMRLKGLRAEIGSSNQKPLWLKALDWDARLEIANEVLDDAILDTEDRRRITQKDYDFEILYVLTNAPPSDWHLPSRVPVGNPNRGHTTGDCKPRLFAREKF